MNSQTRYSTIMLILIVATSGLVAQVPDGWIVMSLFKLPAGGPGGLLLAHPRGLSTAVAVTGLGPDLTGSGSTGVSKGAGSVLCRPSDGAVLVGEHTTSGDSLDIHLITLNGTSVSSDTLFPLGTVIGAVGSVDQMCLMSDTTVLFTIRGVGGALAAGPMAMLDLTTGSATSIAVGGTSGTINALAFDPWTGIAYLGFFIPSAPAASNVYQFQLCIPGSGPMVWGGNAGFVATIPGTIMQLAMGSPGTPYVYAGATSATAPTLFQIDVTTGVQTPLYTTLINCPALAVEDVTGNLVFTTVDPAIGQGALVVGSPTGSGFSTVGTQFGMPLSSAAPSGLAVRPNMQTYGMSAAPGYPLPNQFVIAPNPGGLPIVGNASFSITLAAANGASAGLFAIAQAPADFQWSGATILIDPNSVLALIPLPAGVTPITIPLGIPADPALTGFVGYVQAAMLLPSGSLSTSPGLKITLV